MAQIDVTITVNDINEAPTFSEASYNFTASEDIADDAPIGTVAATDPENDALTFEMTDNDEGLFEVDPNTGAISLVEGLNLDFESFQFHNIVIGVSDGEFNTTVQVTINTLNVPEADPNDSAAFVTTWQAAQGETIEIVINNLFNYDFTINWGDGTIENLTPNGNIVDHTYAAADTYSVSIVGDFPSIQIPLVSSNNILSIENWGAIQWQDMTSAFAGCNSLVYNATDAPNLSQVSSIEQMFALCEFFDGDLSNWNTENIVNMRGVFLLAESFNGDLSGWNTANVTTMEFMFTSAFSFNQNLGSWNISNVTNMTDMLNSCGMSNDNFGNTLIGWANQAPDLSQNITLGATGLNFCQDNPSVVSAMAILTDVNGLNWTINSVGQNCLP